MGSTEDLVRRRVAEALRTEGVAGQQIAREILLLLPDGFIRAYEELFHRALDVGDSGRRGETMGEGKASGATDQDRDGGLRTRGVGGGSRKGGGRKYRDYGSVRSEKALTVKGKVDAKLRKMARDMEDFLRGRDPRLAEGQRRCGQVFGGGDDETGGKAESQQGGSGVHRQGAAEVAGGCGLFVEAGWRYCAGCGRRLSA